MAPAARVERATELVLVEGYLDVIAMSQAGLPNVVAGCGTALTVDQARLIRRHVDSAVALYDGDDAGRRAAARSFPVFVEAGLWARSVFLPQGEDPDTFVRTKGAAALRREIEAGKPLVEAYARHVADAVAGAGSAARVGAELAEVLRKVENPFEYDDFVKKAALWTGISEQVLREQGRPAKKAPTRKAERRFDVPAGPPGAEELLVSVMLADPNCVDRLEGRDILSHLRTEPWAGIAADIFAACDSAGGFQPGDVLAGLDDALRSRIAGRLQEDPAFADEAMRAKVLSDSLAHLTGAEFEAKKRRMLAELRRREEMGDEAGAASLLAEWNRERGGLGRRQ